jgi:hypothetical protein
MEELKTCIKKYQVIDDKLKVLNKSVYSLREDRRCLELELTDLVRLPQFSPIKKFEINDGSHLIVSKPGEWKKPWSLSKKDLTDLTERYYNSTTHPTAKGHTEFIMNEKNKALIGTDFTFLRVVPEEDS